MPEQIPGIPKVPSESLYAGLNLTDPTFKNISQTVQQAGQIPGITETALPSIMDLLKPGGQATAGAEQAIDLGTMQNVAATQTDLMKRGLTGSDIEIAEMGGVRGRGQIAKSQLFSQTANKLADIMMQAVTGDVQHQRGNLVMLAQLMGQELTSQRDLELFREQLSANMGMARQKSKDQMWAALMGAGGQMGSAMMMSDKRYKENLVKHDEVSGIGIYSWTWKKGNERLGLNGEAVGVIAQEVKKIWPELVDDNGVRMRVNYEGLPATVRSAIKKVEGACLSSSAG